MRSRLRALPLFWTAVLAVPAAAFEEGWESAPIGTHRPKDEFSADEKKWRVGDTISNFPEDCGVSPHTAEIVSSGGNKALRLTSVVVDGDCADNIWVVRNRVLDQRFSIPIGPSSMTSFFEEGSLIDPVGHSGSCNALVPPCGDTVSLKLVDNRGNLLVYILQRAPDREEADPDHANYREIQLDPDAGVYERNVFEDFSTIANFVGSGAEIVSVTFTVQEWGTATLDQLSIGESGGPGPKPDGAAAACAAAHLKAAGGLVKGGFGCLGKFAKDPAKDPLGARLDACQGKAETKFVPAWDKATQNAACTLEEPGTDVATDFFASMDELYTADVNGWDPGNRGDRSLRSALLKAFGGLGGSAFSVCSKNAKKPDPGALQRAIETTLRKFSSAADKSIASALRKGVVYTGENTTELAVEVMIAIGTFCEEASP